MSVDIIVRLPRIHGDEPFSDGFVVGIDVFDPVYAGMDPASGQTLPADYHLPRIHGDEPCV